MDSLLKVRQLQVASLVLIVSLRSFVYIDYVVAQNQKPAGKPGSMPIGSDAGALKDATLKGEQFDETLQGPAGQAANPWGKLIERSLKSPGASDNQPTKPATGESKTESELSPSQHYQDVQLIDRQAREFASRYLVGEAIELHLPSPSRLMPLGAKLPPIRLEAS